MTNTPMPSVRSPKQRAHVERVKGSGATTIVLPPKGSGEPSTSWWLSCAQRDGFTQRAKAEADRMTNSRFARVLDPTYR